MIVAALALAACRTAPPTAPPLFTPDAVSATWPVRIATDDTIPADVLAGMARWLGTGSGTWQPPLASAGLPEPLRARARAEDIVAVRALLTIGLEATCRLGATPGAFEAIEAAGGWAAAACDALGRPDAAARARALDATPIPEQRLPATLAELLAPAASIAVELHGQRLEYRFLRPAVLSAPMLATSATPADGSLAGAIRTVRWDPAGPVPDGRGHTTLAAIEAAAEDTVSGWRTSLAALPGLEASLDGVVLGWVRTTLYEELGAQQLDAGPAVALVLLEEAAGGVPRPRPGPGRDPVLLSRVASARWRSGQYGRAAELLRDVASQPGWEFAGMSADMVGRVAVLPSATDPRVRR